MNPLRVSDTEMSCALSRLLGVHGAPTVAQFQVAAPVSPTDRDLSYLDVWLSENAINLNHVRSSVLSEALKHHPPTALQKLLQHQPQSLALAVICSFSNNGYVREQAVINLIPLGDRGLKFLLFRSVDWVSNVAHRAGKGASQLISNASDDELVASLPALALLEGGDQRRRARPTPALDMFLHEIVRRPGFLRRARSRMRASVAEMLITHRLLGDGESWNEVISAALAHKGVAVARAAEREVRALPPSEQCELIESLARSPSPSARQFALDLADQHDRLSVLERGVDDDNARCRNNARFFLERRGVGGFAEHYRSAFPAPFALAGFGETAADEELSDLIPFLSQGLPASRLAVVRCFAFRKVRGSEELLELALTDPSPKIIRTAARLLRQVRCRLSLDAVAALLARPLPDHARRATEAALDLVGRWDSLRLVLELASEGRLVRDLNAFVRAWLSRCSSDFSRPSLEQLDAVKSALAGVGALLSAELAEEVHGELKYWEKRA